jgi:DNA polymerase-3 subunit epsilon
MSNRLISFDTETTGLYFDQGDRVVEIGAVEIIGRNKTGKEYQTYINPEGREMSAKAAEITNINDNQLTDKPLFKDIADEFIDFVRGAELIAHNANFDIGFVNNELKLIDHEIKDITNICKVIDTVVLAKKAFPGQKNNLNSLSARLGVSGYDRTYHGALLDAQILADTYLHLTGGQVTFDLSESKSPEALEAVTNQVEDISFNSFNAGGSDLEEHKKFLDILSKKIKQEVNW